jgi:TusA-related sulfurtransferase
MRSGEEDEVIVDDPTAKETIPKWSKQHGHDIVSIEDDEGHFRIVVRKGKN